MSNDTLAKVDGAESVTALMGNLMAELGGVFERIEWAEDEIARAARRHPGHRDVLFHAFKLLCPRSGLGESMDNEIVYRSHVVELLERVVSGADTRPATAAELCVACKEASLKAPMHDAAAGLYFRMWAQAFPNHPLTSEHAPQQVHYEKLFGSRIDDLERDLRRKVADPERSHSDIECKGKHHGERVNCRFVKQG